MRQEEKIFTLFYHDIFEYPLRAHDIKLWQPGVKLAKIPQKRFSISQKDGFFFFKGKVRLVSLRKKREKLSLKKIEIAKKGAWIISLIPFTKMVGLTGALSMRNANVDSDIDLFVICKKGTLWTTRLLTVLALDLFGIPRNAGGEVEKDKLCLNMWLDEGDLVWDREDRNFYTAHEIAQIVPLVNKNGTYEKFINLNSWVKDYWPNAVNLTKKPKKQGNKVGFLSSSVLAFLIYPLEPLAFWLQYLYMRKRITREIVTPTRAIFHPRDWGGIIVARLR